MWPLSNITSAQNSPITPQHQLTSSSTKYLHHHHHHREHHHHQQQQQRHHKDIITNPIFCQVVSCVNQYDNKDQYRSQSPITIKRNIHCFYDSTLATTTTKTSSTRSDPSYDFDDVEIIYSYNKSTKFNNARSKKIKSTIYCRSPPTSSSSSMLISSPYGSPNILQQRSTINNEHNSANVQNSNSNTAVNKKSNKKTVTFSLVEVREHPRILGDNPSAKKGPPLSIGWYVPEAGRILRYSVDEYERCREPHRTTNCSSKKSMEIVSPTERQRMLLQDVGVTPSEIFAARKEVSKIRKSRRDHNILVNYDETAIVLEHCITTVQRLLNNGTSPESELRALMEQAERSKQMQQQDKKKQQQQQLKILDTAHHCSDSQEQQQQLSQQIRMSRHVSAQ